MTFLTLLLSIKITVTALMVAVPFLFLPAEKLAATMGISGQVTAIFRLYGIAITALLVGYGAGIPVAESGVFPWGVALMGLVSNAGAAAVLFVTGRTGRPRILASFFAAVALALVTAMTKPDMALAPVL
ncbi:hypothetical protein [Kordiimonas marina]|uniref:hypothetical protein n=1 Tax=Kordiimonas marina TaxID=2872312 RepID=UPI001FF3F51C|nr:hypothetical protein [Kordiimonas marina]MCJ9430479.1 hypothetical protein [Kordiimonas marina]